MRQNDPNPAPIPAPNPAWASTLRADAVDAIGRTPLLLLRPGGGAPVYAKLELANPYGMKDRVAKQSILAARADGTLREGGLVVESSSGTLAMGVALVGGYLGHPVHIVTDPRMDAITKAKLAALGATLDVVPAMTANGWQSARLERLRAVMAANPGAFWPRQYDNPQNPAAYEALAAELTAELPRVDVLVGPVGSGGSLCGTARALRRANPGLRVVAVDAAGSVIFGQPDEPRRLQSGLGNSLVPANVDFSVIDEVHWLSDREAFAATLELAARETVFAGNSSGSAYVVARWLAARLGPSATVVVIFPDRGDRYAHTIYDPAYRAAHGLTDLRPPVAPRRIGLADTAESWSYATLGREREYA
ncbi:putative siderophore biosynthesis protein SbnA [Nonomuraea coxensis DSM 45129]|uniref:Siderophore biosynthesis protein SbnA n=1 Tax=Nonomuraea coxensis DSM 45129 TaxID=1122611 RepID=A0ABX8U1N4_9ACTN|nr:cysteine synthase family protein [Nonomuraea coxensis]QYC41610.1 putative siderophore biosynthesis protein SbnA [Nonomuraea coxensis DSM 45129]